MTTTADAVALVLLGTCGAAGLWCAVLALVAWVGGWARLSREVGATDSAAGGSARGLSARFGVANYSGVLTLHADSLGLSLSVLAIFRPFHRPLFLPWSAMRIAGRKGLFERGLRVTFPSTPRVSVTLLRPRRGDRSPVRR